MNDEQTLGSPMLRRVGEAFRANRTKLAQEFFLAFRESQGVPSGSIEPFEQLSEWNQQILYTVTDLVATWLSSNDAAAKLLLQGWVYSELKLTRHEEEAPEAYQPADVVTRAKARWIAALGTGLDAAELDGLSGELDRIIAEFSRPMKKEIRILTVSDCIKWDILTSLRGPCTEALISITHADIGDRVLPIIKNQMRVLDPKQFDLVFFSPFTHQFFAQYAQLLNWRAALWSRKRLYETVEELMSGVLTTLRAITQYFECPVYVHNSAGTVQIFNPTLGMVKEVAAWRNRGAVLSIINQRLRHAIKEPPFAGQVRLLDEHALRKDFSCWELGKVFFHGQIFHPSRVGVELGQRQYFEAVFSAAYLNTKKVVVCDLDNTLWDGVIGEGAVTHFKERQQILKQLRDRGVLLSINSKNDPQNVHFTDGVLQTDDFVAPQINWRPKTENMAAIVKELNLKVKDFVFIDDRPDELERMRNAFPELVALDATRPSTWDVLAHWGTHLSAEMQEDRTKLYHERVERENFLTSHTSAADLQEEAKALRELEISVQLEQVERSGLKRAVELINRTNQFNLCGSRTTLRDEEEGLGTDHWIVLASARDKFGVMGVVGVMRVDSKSDVIEIPTFVLSCRVFGLGIEYALLNAVKRLASPDQQIIGHYRETPANKPGRQLYEKAGLSWDGKSWVGKIADLAPEPEWLTVNNEVPIQKGLRLEQASGAR